MITENQANEFAGHWIAAWNKHDVDQILVHYAENVEFHSPMIALLKFNDEGKLFGKNDLRTYFQAGLTAYPELNFQLKGVFAGVNSVVIYYISVNDRLAAEVFEFDADGNVARVLCNYA